MGGMSYFCGLVIICLFPAFTFIWAVIFKDSDLFIKLFLYSIPVSVFGVLLWLALELIKAYSWFMGGY